MALDTQDIDIDFSNGLDTSADPRTVIPSKVTRAENVEFVSGNTWRQRPGTTQLTLTAVGSSPSVSGIKKLHTLESEALIEASSGLHGYNSFGTVARDDYRVWERMRMQVREPIASALTAGEIDVAYRNGIECWVWTEYDNTVGYNSIFYRTYDATNGSVLTQGMVHVGIAGGVSNPRVVAVANAFYIYYIYTDEIVMRSIDITSGIGALTPAAESAPNTLVGDAQPGPFTFDVWAGDPDDVSLSPYIGLAYKMDTPNLQVLSIDSTDGLTIGPHLEFTTGTFDDVSVCVVPYTGLDPYIVAVCARESTGVLTACSMRASDDTINDQATLYTTGVTTGTLNAVEIIHSPFTNNNTLVLFDTLYGAVPQIFALEMNSVTPSTHANPTLFARDVYLAGRPVARGSTDVLVQAFLDQTADNNDTYHYVLKLTSSYISVPTPDYYDPPVVLSRLPAARSSSAQGTQNLRRPTPFVLTSPETTYCFGALMLQRVTAIAAAPQTIFRPALLKLTATGNQNEALGAGVLNFAGACPALYDGARVVETGFNYAPAAFSAGKNNTGGHLGVGTYRLTYLWEWVDNQNRVHRSAPAVPVSAVTTTGTVSSIYAYLKVYKLTLKQQRRVNTTAAVAGLPTEVRMVVYRTEVNGSVYYRDGVVKNDFTATTDYLYTSTQSDADLIGGEILYTAGFGAASVALENEVFPPTSAICEHQKRLFFIRADTNDVQFTEEDDDPTLALATSADYTLKVPAECGTLRGLISMDDKLIVFGSKKPAAVFGVGPTRDGQQNNYTVQVVEIGTGMGSDAESSLALTPDGVWFYSSLAGMRFLTRGLQLGSDDQRQSFMGNEVDDKFTAAPIAVKPAGRSQVQFWGSNLSHPMVYDFQRKQWSQHNLQSGPATALDSVVYFAPTTSTVWKFQGSAGTRDGTANVDTTIETGWIHLAGRQDFQRVRALMILAECRKTGATFTVSVAYDYKDQYVETATFTGTEDGGSGNTLVQFVHHLAKQKCEALRFLFQTTGPNTNTHEDFRLTSFSLRLGVKKGQFKIPSSNRF